MASCLQKVSSGNESRAQKEKMMKRIFQTPAKDRKNENASFTCIFIISTE